MNATLLGQQLEQLDDADWQAIAHGQGLLLVDDLRLAVGPASHINVLIPPPTDSPRSAAQIRQHALADVEALLDGYYRNHALTLTGFNSQAGALVAQGPADYAAPPGQRPQRTLFVDGGQVVAETPDSPRHPYGAYCELDIPLPAAAAAERVEQWLASGEAYQRYLAMNVCRYNC